MVRILLIVFCFTVKAKAQSFKLSRSDTIYGKVAYKVGVKKKAGAGILVSFETADIIGKHIGHQKKWRVAYAKSDTGFSPIRNSYLFTPN